MIFTGYVRFREGILLVGNFMNHPKLGTIMLIVFDFQGYVKNLPGTVVLASVLAVKIHPIPNYFH